MKDDATTLALARRAMAERSTAGGPATRLRKWGGSTDAHQVKVLGRPDDISVGTSGDGNCANVRAGLRAPHDAGLLTVALVGGTGGEIRANREADHCLVIRSDDPLVVKEGHVTAYHLLWELVHVFFDPPLAARAVSEGPPLGHFEARQAQLDVAVAMGDDRVPALAAVAHDLALAAGYHAGIQRLSQLAALGDHLRSGE
ncbi:MAG: hypothetical protein ABIM89_03050 [Mycobacteriales bacterium]